MPIADPATRRSAADITCEADIPDRRSISLVPQERISLQGFASLKKRPGGPERERKVKTLI